MENKICPNCGVELDEGIDLCPLCDNTNKTKEKRSKASYPSDILDMSEKKHRIYTWELSGIIAFSAILVTFIVDLVLEKGIDWSLYAITTIAGIWILQTAFTYLFKRPIFLGLIMVVDILAMLVLFDLFEAPVNWFVGLGMPICLSFVLLFTGFLYILKKFTTKGFNIVAFVLILISMLCILIEVFSDLYLTMSVKIGWSAIAAVSLVPISWILLFIHYRLKKGNDLRSFFHI